jgi:lipoprotein-anchoring transpeptidase ErfK/SrfK
MVISVSAFSWKMPSVGLAVALAIGLAAPAYAQTSAAATNTGVNAAPPVAQGLPQAQPAVPQAALPPQTSPGTAGAPAATPATVTPSTTGSAPANPPATTQNATTVSETPPPIPKGVRKAADGRLAFTGSQVASVDLPGGGKRNVKSLLNIAKSLSYGEYVWDEQGVPKGRIWILVDPEHQLISVFRGKHEIGTAVTLYGAPEFPTPAGHFRILARMKDHVSRKYNNAPMPYTLRLTNDGVSIHGNNVLEGYASHGCVGVPLDFARRLFAEARLGDEVFVLRDKQPKTAQK